MVGVSRCAVRGVRSFSFRNHPLPTNRQQSQFFRMNGLGLATNLRTEPRHAQAFRGLSTATDTTTRLFYTPGAWPENLYREWTLDQDRLLWSNLKKSPSELAVLLGRGVRGVEKRIEKLKDVDSAAYQRLFVGEKSGGSGSDPIHNNSDESSKNDSNKHKKLVPSSEVLRRIEWDYQLNEDDFGVMHYDRVDDTIVTSPLTAPNDSVDSGETSLIKALPEHRIVAVLYKERVVWDRRHNRKHDLFFGGPGILKVIDTYEEWKQEIDQQRYQQKLLRGAWNDRWVALLMGSELERDRLVRLTEDVLGEFEDYGSSPHENTIDHDQTDETGSVTTLTNDQQHKVDSYIHQTFELFRGIDESSRQGNTAEEDTDASDNKIVVSLFDELSEWIASMCWTPVEYDNITDDDDGTTTANEARILRETLLRKLSATMDKLEGKKTKPQTSAKQSKKKQQQQQQNAKNQQRKLLLNENDIEETFVRGSGSGGQKINKTSNRVVLVHQPTGIRVECQDTRSLQQNRKIGRKRLLEKLDTHFHGSVSKEQTKAKKLQQKKKKTKSKNKSRLAAKQETKKQKKQQMREAQLQQQEEEDAQFLLASKEQ